MNNFSCASGKVHKQGAAPMAKRPMFNVVLDQSLFVFLVSCSLFLSTLRGVRHSEIWTQYKIELTFPLNVLQAYSLPLIAALLSLAALIQIARVVEKGLGPIPWALFFYVVFVSYTQLKFIAVGGEYTQNAFLQLGALLVAVWVLGCSEKKSLADHMSQGFSIVFWGGALFVFFSLSEFVRARDNVIWNGRYNGVAAHPIFCGLYSALTVTVALFFALRKEGRAYIRIICMGVGVVAVGSCLASGSRTALLFLICGLGGVVAPYVRRKAALLILPLLAIVLYIVLKVLLVSEDVEVARSVAIDDTRSEAWQKMWEVFQVYYLWGVPAGVDTGSSESSYLLALAIGGLFGMIFFIPFLAITLWAGYRFLRSVTSVPDLSAVLGLASGFFFMSLLEGFLHDAATFTLFSFFILSGIIAFDPRRAASMRSAVTLSKSKEAASGTPA